MALRVPPISATGFVCWLAFAYLPRRWAAFVKVAMRRGTQIAIMSLYADVLIVTVTKVESKAVFDVFQEATGGLAKPTLIDDRVYHDLGIINGARAFMVQSEMGSGGLGASQQTVQKGIMALSPAAVIMTGIAFGVNASRQSIGDVLVSQQLRLYELQRVSTEDGSLKLIPRGDRPHASPWLFNLFQSADLYWDESKAKVRFGLILSGEKLVDNVDFRQQLHDFEREAMGGEMEGAGLYVACQDAKVDWILVKAICDWADGHKTQDKDERQRLAAHNAVDFVLHVLQQVSLKQAGDRRNIPTGIHEAIPQLKLRLYKMGRDQSRRDEIFFETHRALPQQHQFGLVLENTTESTMARGVYIRVEFSWRGNDIVKAPWFQAPRYSGWTTQVSQLVCEQQAVLTFKDPNLPCFYGQPIEWDNARLTIDEYMEGYLLVHYNVSSVEPHIDSSGQLKIVLGGK